MCRLFHGTLHIVMCSFSLSYLQKFKIVKKVAIIGTAFIPRKSMEVEPLDIIIDDTATQHVEFEIKNYRIEPQFIPNLKVRCKYKRNLKYK